MKYALIASENPGEATGQLQSFPTVIVAATSSAALEPLRTVLNNVFDELDIKTSSGVNCRFAIAQVLDGAAQGEQIEQSSEIYVKHP